MCDPGSTWTGGAWEPWGMVLRMSVKPMRTACSTYGRRLSIWKARHTRHWAAVAVPVLLSQEDNYVVNQVPDVYVCAKDSTYRYQANIHTCIIRSRPQ